MAKRNEESVATREPTRELRYLGLRFIEYPDSYDFRLATGASRMTRVLGLFTLLVVGGLVATGLLVKVHVKVPVAGQMTPKDPEFVPSRIEGKVVRVEVKSNQEVKQGDLLVTIDATEQGERIEKFENQRDTARQSVQQAEEEILAATSQRKQAENRLASLGEQKETRTRELTQHEEQVALKLKDFTHQKERAQLGIQTAEVNTGRIQSQLDSQKASQGAQLKSLELRIESAQIDLDAKKAVYEKDERLYHQGAVPEAQAQASENAYRQARNAFDTAQNEYARTKIDLEGRLSGLEKDFDQAKLESQTRKMEESKLSLEEQTFTYESRNKERSIEDAIRDAERQIESARLEIQAAETKINSAQSNKKIAELQVENFESDLEKAREDLDKGREIRAPMDGYVRDLLVEAGQKVTPGQPLVKIASRELEFVGAIESRYHRRVEPGQPVKIKFEEFQKGGSEDVEHPGEVIRVTDDEVKQGPKKMYVVKIRIDPPRAEEHRDEMPGINNGGTGNVLTQEMPLLKYWLLHKILKKV